ncbi:MAG: 4Fe-4S binding protein [Candidatus Eisenbacteria bacterium]
MASYGKHTKLRLLVGILVLLIIVLAATSPLWCQERAGRRGGPSFFDVWLLPRVWIAAALSLVGLWLLARSRVTRGLRLAFLAVIFFLFSVVAILPLGSFAAGMGVHPSPVCVVTRPFQFIEGGRAVPIAFISLFVSFVILSVLGNKLFCGWVCPVGALQEAFHRIPVPKGLARNGWKIKLPFTATNIVRAVILAVFFLTVFVTGVSVYDYFNPFESLHWGFERPAITVLLVTILASLFIFRPFCYLVCPLGLITWLLEHVAVFRVRVDKEKCTNCDVCAKLSPCPAVPAIVEGRRSRPDCHTCGRCLEVCPEKALSFRA